MTIYIGNLAFVVEEDDIREIFEEFSKVRRISMPIDRETGKKRGFAFVELEDESREDLAIEELNGAEWVGRELKVNKAKGRDSGPPARPPSRSFTVNPLD